MEILEFGNKQNKKIILIHGFQSPYQIWNTYIEYYKEKYHVIVPILEGHNPKVKEEFISLKETANKIENYCISKYGNDIYAIYGMSYGGIIAANIWQNKRLNIENLIFDGSPLVSYPKILKSYLTNFYLQVTHKSKQREINTIKQAEESICPKELIKYFLKVLDNMSDETIINYIEEWNKYKLPKDINILNTKIFYYHGTKMNEMLAKKTAKYIKRYYSNSKIIKNEKKGHCEISIFKPNEMIEKLNEIL